MKDKILEWFITGECGISSKAMASAVVGIAPRKPRADLGNHPLDPDDLNRCIKFLNAVPDARHHFDKVSAISDTWGKLISRWDELENCFLDEVGLDWCKGRSAPKTYKLMQEIGC